MSHGKELTYKVCVYYGNTRQYQVLKTFRSYSKANDFLRDYLKYNDDVSRAFIEKACSYKNNKREQWR